MKWLFCFSCFWMISLWSAPNGNPATPYILKKGFFIPAECWANIRIGYEGDFIFDGKMEQKEEGDGDVDRYRQTVNSGIVTLNLLHRLDLYSVFGSSRTSSHWRFKDGLGAIHNGEFETFHNLLWAVGFRSFLARWNRWGIGLGARYSSSHPHFRTFTIDGTQAPLGGSLCRWTEWQINLGASYHVHFFTPYVALNCMRARTKLALPSEAIGNGGAHTNHFQTSNPVGINIGCTLSTESYFLLNLEARLIDEEALSLSGEFRF